MAHISGIDRSQELLLPERVEDYVGENNPVRFIDAFVDGLDLSKAGFAKVHPKSMGRSCYDPGDLLKLYIYGYLNRVRSSRRLEIETHRNIEVIWLLRHLKPDFKTIADFRRTNRAAFKQVFREFVLLCRQLDLFGRELLAVDGTRIKAVNSKDRNFTKTGLQKDIKRADEQLDAYLKQVDNGDDDEGHTSSTADDPKLGDKIASIKAKQDRHKALLDEMKRTGESQISLSDPDSRYQSGQIKAGVSYNAQIAVDCKHKLIVEQDVYSQIGDLGLLAKTAAPAREILGVEAIDVVADRGYFKIEDIEACEDTGLVAHVAKPKRGSAISGGLFPKEKFNYDSKKDGYICPNGSHLNKRHKRKIRNVDVIGYYNRKACKNCPCSMKVRCTNAKFRKITRYDNEQVLEQMAARVKAKPDLMNKRRESVEHPFGSIKQWMNQGAFLMRRLENVRAEFSLTALVYNITRALNLVGVQGLMTAIRG